MHVTTERLERLQRSLELALNQEWPHLSATQKRLANLRPTPIPIRPPNAKPGTVRRITVELTDEAKKRHPGAEIQARKGYVVR